MQTTLITPKEHEKHPAKIWHKIVQGTRMLGILKRWVETQLVQKAPVLSRDMEEMNMTERGSKIKKAIHKKN